MLIDKISIENFRANRDVFLINTLNNITSHLTRFFLNGIFWIVKRRYSYSQVYQLRAISDLKRPSMCTFITKNDADKLLEHYLTAENVYRLQFIHWIPPILLGDKQSDNKRCQFYLSIFFFTVAYLSR